MFWVGGGGGSKHRTYNDRNTSSAPQDNYPLHSRWSLLSPPQYMFHPLQLWSPMHAHRYYTWIQKREVNQTCFFWGGGGVESIRYLKPLFATAAEYQLSWTFLAVLPPLDSAICWPNHLGFLHALGKFVPWFVMCWNKFLEEEMMGCTIDIHRYICAAENGDSILCRIGAERYHMFARKWIHMPAATTRNWVSKSIDKVMPTSLM